MSRYVALVTPTCVEFAQRYARAARQTGVVLVILATEGSDITPAAFPSDRVIPIDGLSHRPAHLVAPLKAIDGLIGVVPASEFSVEAAEFLARELALPTAMSGPAERLRNKVAMRQAFEARGVPQPRLIGSAGSLQDMEALCAQIPAYPVILKPVDMAGSWHVSLCHDKASLLERCIPIFDYRKSIATGLPFAGRCLVETYLHGQEYSAEVVVCGGEIHDLFITRKFISALPYFDEVGHCAGWTLEADIESAVRDCVRGIIASAQVDHSVIHVEFRLTSAGDVGVIEVGCRVPGDMITDLVEMTYGVSLEEQMLRVKACLPLADCGSSIPTPHSIEFFFAPADIDAARSDPSVVDLCIYPSRTSPVAGGLSAQHLARRLGYAIRRETAAAPSRLVLAHRGI